MSKTHTIQRVLTLQNSKTLRDIGATYTGDTVENSDWVIPDNEDTDNAIELAFVAAGFKSMFLVASVRTTVTFNGATAIDGIATSDVALAPGVGRHVAAWAGDVTDVSISPNEDGGSAGVLKVSILRNT